MFKKFKEFQQSDGKQAASVGVPAKAYMKVTKIAAQYDEDGNVLRDDNGVNIGPREVVEVVEVAVSDLPPEIRKELGLG